MSIPIPLILALLAQKNTKPQNQSQVKQSIVPSDPAHRPQISRVQHGRAIANKLNGVAQLVGGSRGQKIGSVARTITAVSSINSPINALSLLAKGGLRNSGAGNMLTQGNMPNLSGTSKIYNNINNMLNNMDKDKKDELLSMAESIMKP